MELVRYIHLNPLQAQLISEYKKLSRYPFCGHSVLMGKRIYDWQDAEYVLALFGTRRFQMPGVVTTHLWKKGIEDDRKPELVGGGLIRNTVNARSALCYWASRELVPIYWNHIMFAHDLCDSRIEYFRNAIDLNRKDRAKRYHKSSIFNRQYSIPACPGWVLALWN